ncbi:unnamed protein product [Rotaria sp. Silwood1]|nr:unnamed protein product [Rotaria sp. Silwood1]CAF1687910.1 unnamed protein product [Rotaria sp. Silwood1]
MVNDCENRFDKPSTCPQQRCTSTQFQCRNQNYTSISYVCDEEENCTYRCMPGTFRCSCISSSCLPMVRLVFKQKTHYEICGDNSDENSN